MGFDAFLKIDSIDGESADENHPEWIEIIDYGFGVRQTVSTTASSAGGASAERADFREFKLRKLLDKASPKLAQACADGTHIDEIIVELHRAGTNKVKFMEYQLTNCLISQVATIGGRNFPSETLHINFGKIMLIYSQQNRSGGGSIGTTAVGWDLEKNCKI